MPYGMRAHNKDYALTAAISHVGLTAQSGHYLAFVRMAGSWFQCDDSSVCAIPIGASHAFPAHMANADPYIALYSCLPSSVISVVDVTQCENVVPGCVPAVHLCPPSPPDDAHMPAGKGPVLRPRIRNSRSAPPKKRLMSKQPPRSECISRFARRPSGATP